MHMSCESLSGDLIYQGLLSYQLSHNCDWEDEVREQCEFLRHLG